MSAEQSSEEISRQAVIDFLVERLGWTDKSPEEIDALLRETEWYKQISGRRL